MQIVKQSMEIAKKMAVKITMIPINFSNFNITLVISEIRRVSTYLNYVRFHLFFRLAFEDNGIYEYDMKALHG